MAQTTSKWWASLGTFLTTKGFIHLNIEADFIIFSPKRGKKLVGAINKVAPSHIGCLTHGCFNAPIPKPEQMSIVQWQVLGWKIEDELKFQVLHWDSDAVGVLFIRGGLTKSSMRPKKSETITDSTNRDEIPKLDHQENSFNDSGGGGNVTEQPLGETDNTGRENGEEQNVDAMNGVCDDKNKKKTKKHKQEEQEHVLPTSDSSGYQSDHKKSKKKKRKESIAMKKVKYLRRHRKGTEVQSDFPE